MTSKPKPTATSKKRPQPEKKPAKVVAKKAAPVPEKERKAAAPVPKKGATLSAKAHGPTHAAAPGATLDPKAAAKLLAEKDKKALSARPAGVPEDRQSQLKLLIARGKEQGYLTYAQVNDHLPSEIVDPEQIEDIVNTINDMGIPVYEKAPDTESLLQNEPSAPADEEAIEEAAAALAALDAELGRTTDPVRMYMRRWARWSC